MPFVELDPEDNAPTQSGSGSDDDDDDSEGARAHYVEVGLVL